MPAHWSIVQFVEFFHLALLGVLQVRLNQKHYVLKGGANLRYFCRSPRYSEDVDFDAAGMRPEKLEERVDAVLSSRALAFALRTHDLAIQRTSKPKQTPTTQRWKLTLAYSGFGEPIWTKVEFSHRGTDPRTSLDKVPDEVVRLYAVRPPTVMRYLPAAMIEQKIAALAGRTETQARDVFDLELLCRQWPDAVAPGAIPPRRLEAAAERTRQLSFESYSELVIRFLDPDIRELYDRREAWDQMQARVLEKLMALR
ncbi:MAG: nucleotidyl transferase AbiEii/AbiGii toxin family protein [Candidatus Methylomirabilis sp.]